ncbi:MAG: stage IV sporulation protein A [Acutalibacteraceae bacterium]|nr:stage IV sporulation protein A [Acutalibacteraceae bacterium]
MEERNIYQDIAQRTNGDIYIGVVGPVRTGKSTFIKRFMDAIVIPNIENQSRRDRAVDELPQSSAGRTIMTTEPKFIPEDAVEITLDGNASLRVRAIDCVGYIVPSALGYIEDEQPRMVKTPWFDEQIPFNMAAEIGTKKVITDHSTIGLVVTTDGSISDIPREEYAEAEERVIAELKEINKPFIVLLNSMYPQSPETTQIAKEIGTKHNVPVVAVNCVELDEIEIKRILAQILFEFPIKEIKINMPKWVTTLEKEHWLKNSVYSVLSSSASKIKKIREIQSVINSAKSCENIHNAEIDTIDLGKGTAKLSVILNNSLFYKVLGEKTGLTIADEGDMLNCVMELAKMKADFDKIRKAYENVNESGYGIVMPTMEELSLEEPEIIKQGGKYGIRLRASAPSIHLMKTNITTEVTPIVGSEQQSEELVSFLLKEFEENPIKIWESNIFGKSLHELVNEGLHNKLNRMPLDARNKMKETIERIINEGCNGLICIIL